MKYIKGTFVTVPNIAAIKGVNAHTQAVYLWICIHADTFGKCFPSVLTLAKEAGMGKTKVKQAVAELEKLGVIKKTIRKKKGKFFASNFYQLMQLDMGKFREYDESKHQDDGLPSVDAESGEMRAASAPKNVKSKYWELIKWAEKKRGSPFLKQSIPKQFKAFAIAKTNGIKPPDLLKRWAELQEDKFYSERGFDWMDVVQSFNRKGK